MLEVIAWAGAVWLAGGVGFIAWALFMDWRGGDLGESFWHDTFRGHSFAELALCALIYLLVWPLAAWAFLFGHDQ